MRNFFDEVDRTKPPAGFGGDNLVRVLFVFSYIFISVFDLKKMKLILGNFFNEKIVTFSHPKDIRDMATTTKHKKLNPKKGSKNERDFNKEYVEILSLLKLELESIEFEKGENYGNIKKFSLFKKSPTPILSGNTFPS